MREDGVDFTRQDLLEHSACPVPAHPQALTLARSKGIDVAPLKSWAEKMLDEFTLQGDGAEVVRRQVAQFRVQADPKGRKSVVIAARKDDAPVEPAVTIPEGDLANISAALDLLEQHAETGTAFSDAELVALRQAYNALGRFVGVAAEAGKSLHVLDLDDDGGPDVLIVDGARFGKQDIADAFARVL
jgi:hypothetical protein